MSLFFLIVIASSSKGGQLDEEGKCCACMVWPMGIC